MKESLAREKIRIIDVIKENATMVLAIGGFVWIVYSYIILPIKSLEFSVADVINNHLKTIQDEQITATNERKAQSLLLNALNENVVRLQEQIKLLK